MNLSQDSLVHLWVLQLVHWVLTKDWVKAKFTSPCILLLADPLSRLSTACFLLGYRRFLFLREKMSYYVSLTPRMLMVRTHCLAENVAFIGLKYLLVPQSQQLAISKHLCMCSLWLLSLMTSLLWSLSIWSDVVEGTHAYQSDCVHWRGLLAR